MFSGLTTQDWTLLLAIGLLAALVAVLAVFLAGGLFTARSLIRRELSAYFLSPIAYVVLVVFLIVTGYFFYLTLEQLTAAGPKGVEYPMQSMFGDKWFWAVFLFIPPLLTMRLFAEERSTGTLEMLMTAPLRDWQVVLCKYVACFAFYVFMWLPTLVYLPVLLNMGAPIVDLTGAWTVYSILLVGGLGSIIAAFLLAFLPGGTTMRLVAVVLLLVGAVAAGVGGWQHYHVDAQHILEVPIGVGIDPMPVLTTYLGVALAGAMFLALGLLVSSLVRSQMVAALVSLVLMLVFILAAVVPTDLDAGSADYRALYFISVPLHFSRDFTRGLLDTRHLTLYASVAAVSLFLTVRSLESRRWR